MSPDTLTKTNIMDEVRKKVLLVDDEQSILDMLGETLDVLGYDPRLAIDGDRAESILKEEEMDLIISDILLPGRDGVDLLGCYQAYQPEVPIVMMTGCGKINLAIECFKRGAVDFLTKPISPDKLDDIIKKALKRGSRKRRGIMSACIPKLNGFRFLKVLGEGSMGIVYLVESDDHDAPIRQYALKTFKSLELARGDKTNHLQQRFENEAKVAFAIQHPNVIQVYDFGRDEDGIPYLLMEYFDGVPIDKAVRLHALSMEGTCYLLKQVASALHTIHECGVCHRDIKPSNVLANDQFEVRVMDFGIARLQDSTLTTSQNFLGSPPFMSPEMFVTAKVDGRSDIFSLGSLAYFALTGERPFQGEDLTALAYNLRFKEPIWPKKLGVDLPAKLEAGLKKMLAKRPEKRFDSALEVFDLLSEFSRPPK